jgi:hypothetical protein
MRKPDTAEDGFKGETALVRAGSMKAVNEVKAGAGSP